MCCNSRLSSHERHELYNIHNPLKMESHQIILPGNVKGKTRSAGGDQEGQIRARGHFVHGREKC